MPSLSDLLKYAVKLLNSNTTYSAHIEILGHYVQFSVADMTEVARLRYPSVVESMCAFVPRVDSNTLANSYCLCETFKPKNAAPLISNFRKSLRFRQNLF